MTIEINKEAHTQAVQSIQRVWTNDPWVMNPNEFYQWVRTALILTSSALRTKIFLVSGNRGLHKAPVPSFFYLPGRAGFFLQVKVCRRPGVSVDYYQPYQTTYRICYFVWNFRYYFFYAYSHAIKRRQCPKLTACSYYCLGSCRYLELPLQPHVRIMGAS